MVTYLSVLKNYTLSYGRFLKASTTLSLLLIAIGFIGCKDKSTPTISFYYWRTNYKLSKTELNTLAENRVSRLYIRYFDVVSEKGVPTPVSPVSFSDTPKTRIVPVVYIKNEVLLLPTLNVTDLAKNMWKLMNEMNASIGVSIEDIQLDCDWTVSSKDAFFKLITELKTCSKKNILSTVRLHQIKYSKSTGVPPAGRGVLMFYNMGKIASDKSNSIYDSDIAKKYTDYIKQYPINLDVALPIYSWAIHIRNDKPIFLINKPEKTVFYNDTNFVQVETNRLLVKNKVIKGGRFYEKGDVLKFEWINASDLLEMSAELGNKMTKKPKEIILFDLDENNLNQYKNETQLFNKIVRNF